LWTAILHLDLEFIKTMITGKLLGYYYNDLKNKNNRNRFFKINVAVEKPEEFKQEIHNALDKIPVGKGYVLIGWNGKMFIAERDIHNVAKVEYLRHEIKWHPLMDELNS